MANVYCKKHVLVTQLNTTTYISAFNKSCIDLIFGNAQYVHSYGTLCNVISDHYPVYICRKKPREHKTFMKSYGRTYGKYNKTLFQSLLQQYDWERYFNETDPNVLWEIIFDIITHQLSVMCPLKKIRITSNAPPWLTPHIF